MIWDRIEVTLHLFFFSLLFEWYEMDLSLHSIFLTAYITTLSVFQLPVVNCGNISVPKLSIPSASETSRHEYNARFRNKKSQSLHMA